MKSPVNPDRPTGDMTKISTPSGHGEKVDILGVSRHWRCELCGHVFDADRDDGDSCEQRDFDGSWCGGQVREYVPATQRGVVDTERVRRAADELRRRCPREWDEAGYFEGIAGAMLAAADPPPTQGAVSTDAASARDAGSVPGQFSGAADEERNDA